MAKAKHSVTIDPGTLAEAKELVAVSSLSELIDVALRRLVRSELERRHVEGYTKHPPQAGEAAWADIARDSTDIADETDWASLYGVTASQ